MPVTAVAASAPALLNLALDSVAVNKADRSKLPPVLLRLLERWVKLKFFHFFLKSKLRKSIHAHRSEGYYYVGSGNNFIRNNNPGVFSENKVFCLWLTFCNHTSLPYREYSCSKFDLIEFLDLQVINKKLSKGSAGYSL